MFNGFNDVTGMILSRQVKLVKAHLHAKFCQERTIRTGDRAQNVSNLTDLTEFNRLNGRITENGPDDDTPGTKLQKCTKSRPNRPGSFGAFA